MARSKPATPLSASSSNAAPKAAAETPGVHPQGENVLLTRPTNRETKRIFVAATRMNDGKTTTCLGLFAAMRALYSRIGFIKPVGQRFVEVDGHMVDEDSYLLDTIYNVQVPIESMSPITVDATFTRRYLTNPGQTLGILIDKICRAFDRVSWEKDFTLIEGTGHAGVGSVFDLSNARVARLLDAKAIIVAQGGIGRPIDEIALNKALFDKEGVEVIGAILNKVQPDKIGVVAEYAEKGLRNLGVPLLGVLPVQEMLTAPNLSQIAEEIGGRWLNGRSYARLERVQRVVIGAMTAKGVVDYLQPGVLIIAPGDRDDIILAAISSAGISGQKVVSGIILTSDLLPHPKLMEMLTHTNIPVVVATEDSYTVASRIHGMTVKTQPEDADKIPVIKRVILEHVNLDQLVNSF
jgi:BioD-like phosphotransacetylase family protein